MQQGYIKKKWSQYKNSKRWWSILLDFLFLILIVLMLIPTTRKSLSAFVVRQTLISPRESARTTFLSQQDWEMQLINYNGETSLLQDKSDKPIFLNYWATWCAPCIAELPSIQNFYDNFKDEVNFIFVSNENPDVVEAFMQKRGYNLPLYRLTAPAPEKLETSTLPTSIVIGKGGRIVLYKTGAAKWDSKKVARMMNRLIDESKE